MRNETQAASKIRLYFVLLQLVCKKISIQKASKVVWAKTQQLFVACPRLYWFSREKEQGGNIWTRLLCSDQTSLLSRADVLSTVLFDDRVLQGTVSQGLGSGGGGVFRIRRLCEYKKVRFMKLSWTMVSVRIGRTAKAKITPFEADWGEIDKLLCSVFLIITSGITVKNNCTTYHSYE